MSEEEYEYLMDKNGSIIGIVLLPGPDTPIAGEAE
jgi:hypothetical protein